MMLPTAITVAGVTLHLYGLILGLGVVSALLIAERVALVYRPGVVRSGLFWRSVVLALVLGLLGARAWHVVTSFNRYAAHPEEVIAIWQGGLSIIGGVIGGVLGVFVATRLKTKTLSESKDQKKNEVDKKVSDQEKITDWRFLLDVASFGLPIGQAIGRFGNYINQELYGLPTNLPWAISIDVRHRAKDYAAFKLFHPLFFYELLCLVFYWIWAKHALNRSDQRGQKLGTGFFFLTYVFSYAWIRFWLDFLRIDKPLFLHTPLSTNQVVLALGGLVIILVLGRLKWLKLLRGLAIMYVLIGVIVTGLVLQSQNYIKSRGVLVPMDQTTLSPFEGLGSVGQESQTYDQEVFVPKDHELVTLLLGDYKLRVEAVTTPASWTQGLSGRQTIGSDGLLFVFPSPQQRQFWMFDMLFDIDIIWFKDGKVVGTTPLLIHPSPGTRNRDLVLYDSPGEVDWVLEVPAGFVHKSGIITGMNGMITAEYHD